MTTQIDLGHGHILRWLAWRPDRELNPQYRDLPDVEHYGAIIAHVLPGGGQCEGVITFSSEVQQRIEPGRPVWNVTSWEPLTCHPSLLCHCGDHGFIQQGRWVPV